MPSSKALAISAIVLYPLVFAYRRNFATLHLLSMWFISLALASVSSSDVNRFPHSLHSTVYVIVIIFFKASGMAFSCFSVISISFHFTYDKWC